MAGGEELAMGDRTVTVRLTNEQWVRWRQAARSGATDPDLEAYLAHAADFYAVRLDARRGLARRLVAEGRL